MISCPLAQKVMLSPPPIRTLTHHPAVIVAVFVPIQIPEKSVVNNRFWFCARDSHGAVSA